jgi:hypothetical protein
MKDVEKGKLTMDSLVVDEHGVLRDPGTVRQYKRHGSNGYDCRNIPAENFLVVPELEEHW